MLPSEETIIPDILERSRDTFYHRLVGYGITPPLIGYPTDLCILDFVWPKSKVCVLLSKFDSDLHNHLTSEGWKVFYFYGVAAFRTESYYLVGKLNPSV